MRLRLTILRHALPPVRILWTLGSHLPHQHPDEPASASPLTSQPVSKFLEAVNEIVPLEAEQWGLEDYAVEVDGFECLHFETLGRVLREGDLVV